MRARFAGVILTLALLAPAAYAEESATLTLAEETLNRLVGKLGVLSDTGMFQPYTDIVVEGFEICHSMGFIDCPWLPGGELGGFSGTGIPLVMCESHGGGVYLIPLGEPVMWQWWVTGAGFSLEDGSMTFTATVRTRAAGAENTTTRSVPASVSFNGSTSRVVINIGNFDVPVRVERGARVFTAATVDVDRLYGISIPLAPQSIAIPPIQGSTPKTVTGSIEGLPRVDYQAGTIVLHFDVDF